jgi:hypothetical protein
MATETERLSVLEHFARDMSEHYWRFQGRLNALEICMTIGTLNFAKMQVDPFKFVQDYVEALRQTSKQLMPDVQDSTKADRLTAETKDSIDELLAQLLQQAGPLRRAD